MIAGSPLPRRTAGESEALMKALFGGPSPARSHWRDPELSSHIQAARDCLQPARSSLMNAADGLQLDIVAFSTTLSMWPSVAVIPSIGC
jgi:hypothetical protein